MRRRRAALIMLLALHAAMSAAPARALIVCVSADGRAVLEFAVPGTWRCDDRECAPRATAADQHSCRDFPVLASATAALHTAAHTLLAAAQPVTGGWMSPPVALNAAPGLLLRATASAAHAVQHRRSTVLRC